MNTADEYNDNLVLKDTSFTHLCETDGRTNIVQLRVRSCMFTKDKSFTTKTLRYAPKSISTALVIGKYEWGHLMTSTTIGPSLFSRQ